MVRLKSEHVNMTNLADEMYFALGAVAALHMRITGKPAVVTSAQDSSHSAKSLHHQWDLSLDCKALDFRTHDLTPVVRDDFVSHVEAMLEPCGFDCVLENVGGEQEHLHVEFDPKSGESLWRVGT